MARCAGDVRMWLVVKLTASQSRHPELVSGSIVRHSPPVAADRWTLKRVQGDGWGFKVTALGLQSRTLL